MKVSLGADTDTGRVRDHNEDSFGIGEGPAVERLGYLLVVCDGMGGHAAGEVASRRGVDTILQAYYADDSDEDDRPAALEQAFSQANAVIYGEGRGNMGTTGVAALLYHDALHVANVGDSRAYLIRNGSIRQISRDHSFVSDQVAAGLITPEDARTSPVRNVITRALGHQSEVTVDLFRFPLQVGDLVLLSSDGLHGPVTDAELAEIATAAPPAEAVAQLVKLANDRGGQDNITALIVRVDRLDWDAELLAADDDADEPDSPIDAPQDADIAPAVTLAPVEPPQPSNRQNERHFTRKGGLLAAILLVVLACVIALTLNQPINDTRLTHPPATVVLSTP